MVVVTLMTSEQDKKIVGEYMEDSDDLRYISLDASEREFEVAYR